MIYSMTGFGRAEANIQQKNFIAEVRSLNGKQYDLRLSIPSLLKPYEFEIRSMLNTALLRGSVECIITSKQNGSLKQSCINNDLLKSYYMSVLPVATELNANTDGLFSALLRIPEIISASSETLSDAEWAICKNALQEAIDLLNQHRRDEGKSMEDDLLLRIENIEKLQGEVAALEPLRREKIREGMKRVLEENTGKENYDTNRMEQELIYYIEKIDISEEQVRLKNHCDYFREILAEAEIAKGKKLSFILQEIGREINTTGSKAYDSTIQKCVVLMKDELEKAKEQILNIL
ncbi:MAG: YicC/YloC family endoribonuclease [Chitinophagaceae bacterium]